MADHRAPEPSEPEPLSPAPSHHLTPSERTLDVEEPTNVSEKLNDEPPDGGYGWVCVGCCFFINAHTWGINSTYGVFLSYYLNHDIFPGASALAYAFIGGLSISQAMLIAPLATHVIHLYGTKVCLHIGIFFETFSLIGASFAHKEWQIILAQGVCFGWGMGFLFVGSVGTVPQWFTKKRSVANAVGAAGSGLGGMTYSLATQAAIDSVGLAWAFRILGICAFTVNMIASNLLRDRNKQTGSRHVAFDFKMLKRPEFILLQGWSFFSMLGYVAVLFSLPAYARAIGLTFRQGSIVGAILNLGQMAGRPFIGLSSDRWGRLNLATLYTFLCALFIFVFWIPAEVVPNPYALLLFFAVVGGGLIGTLWATIAPIGAEVVGLQDLPAALSWTWILMVPPTTVAEPIALELRRKGVEHWIYIPPQIFTGCMYVGAGLCLWLVRGWKIGQLEELERRNREGGSRQLGVDSNEKQGRPDEVMVQRVRTPSISAADWQPRDLLRRMVVVRKV